MSRHLPAASGRERVRSRMTNDRITVPQGRTIIARSFNCGWSAANGISPAGAAENVLFQPSRWDGLRLCASNPQLKLRAIVKRASGAFTLQRFNAPRFNSLET